MVVTDLDVHAMWLCRYTEQYFVALEETKVHLVALEYRKARSPSRAFLSTRSLLKRKIPSTMRRTGLDENQFTILVSAGGFGVGPVEHIIEATLRACHAPPQVIVVCGRNEELHARLKQVVSRFTKTSGVKFRLLGFTTEMDELMAASDLFVGKPGGLTTSEAIAKGLPMVVINPIPGRKEQFRSSPRGGHCHPLQQSSRPGLQDRSPDRRARQAAPDERQCAGALASPRRHSLSWSISMGCATSRYLNRARLQPPGERRRGRPPALLGPPGSGRRGSIEWDHFGPAADPPVTGVSLIQSMPTRKLVLLAFFP